MSEFSSTQDDVGTAPAAPERVVIMGAAGRDFHNFNMVYRDNPSIEVVAFTAAQIPKIAERRYPPSLAGPYYPQGIPIVEESELSHVCGEHCVTQVIFAYSDVHYRDLMHMASTALATGADFRLIGPARTMLPAAIPVIATSAVRTGCGKSPTTRWLSRLLSDTGLRAAVIRHPMPYGDLARQAAQTFTSQADLDAAECTIEEREEYEPHLALGNVVYAGVDYARIVSKAERAADVILWDGGNNDYPFLRPDLHIVLVDALRPGDEQTHYPGEAVLRLADIVVIAKSDSATPLAIKQVTENVRQINESAPIVHGYSPIHLEAPERVRGARVLVIEDGPTITHGGMSYGAGHVAATRAEAADIIDPREYAADEIRAVYRQYPHIGAVLPAVGYHPTQLKALEQTINATPADVVIAATPCDLNALLRIDKPVVRARYEFADADVPGLRGLVTEFLRDRGLQLF